jgi:glutathione S-transferase
MRLYYHPMSANSRRAMMAAIHLGTKLELTIIDLGKGEQRNPAFLTINPNGRVPVLDDDGFLLTESHAIMQYLADLTPGQTVYPTELRARADVNRWLFWSANHFQPSISVLGWENVVKPMIGLGAADPKEVARGERMITQCADVLDAHLENKSWVAQDRLTLADFALAAALTPMLPAKLPIMGHVHLQAWFKRVQALDAWVQSGT